MNYPHSLKLTRPVTSPDGKGGTTVTGSTTTYDGRADAQEGGEQFRQADGTITHEGDAVAFLPGPVSGIEQSDSGTLTWEDGEEQAVTVAKTNRLDDKLLLRYD